MKRFVLILLALITVLSVFPLAACGGGGGNNARSTITREEWDAFVNTDNITTQSIYYSEGYSERATSKIANGFYCFCLEAMNDAELQEWESERNALWEQLLSNQQSNDTSTEFDDLIVDDLENLDENKSLNYNGVYIPLSECVLSFSHKDNQGNFYGSSFYYKNCHFASPSNYGCYKTYLDKTYCELHLYAEDMSSVTKWIESDFDALEYINELYPAFSELTYDEEEKAYFFYISVEEQRIKCYIYFENGVPVKSITFAQSTNGEDVSNYTPKDVGTCDCDNIINYYFDYGTTTIKHTFNENDIVERIN